MSPGYSYWTNLHISSVTINVQFIHLVAKRKNGSISNWSLDIFDLSGERSHLEKTGAQQQR